MKNNYTKCLINYDENVLNRVALMNKLSKLSLIFPVLNFDLQDKKIVQYSESISSFKWPEDKIILKKLWIEFKNEISNLHKQDYVHGDILKKNIVFDGLRLRLIDHELSLVIGNELRVTHPWVAIEDIVNRAVSRKTDLICIKATELRLFDYDRYIKFRILQTELVSNYSKTIEPSSKHYKIVQ
jgi:serine/threonine protein kinase